MPSYVRPGIRKCAKNRALSNEAIAEMQQRAEAMGAHAVVGVDIDYEVLGADNGMLMVTASGTAVQIARTA